MFNELYQLTAQREDTDGIPLVMFGIFFNTSGDALSVETVGIDGYSDFLMDDDDVKEYIENNGRDYTAFVDAVIELCADNGITITVYKVWYELTDGTQNELSFESKADANRRAYALAKRDDVKHVTVYETGTI